MRGWSDSRALTRQSWAVLKDNRYLMAYPVVGIVAGIMPFGVIAGGVFFIALNQNWIGWALVVIGLYLLTLVTAVVQAALTVSAAAELEGGHSSLGHGLGTAFGRLGRLARWAFVGTVVNLLVGLLRGNNSGGLVSVIFRNVLAAAADVMWQLITFFVMPAMMLDDLGMITQSRSPRRPSSSAGARNSREACASEVSLASSRSCLRSSPSSSALSSSPQESRPPVCR
jgi:hypothetical protein